MIPVSVMWCDKYRFVAILVYCLGKANGWDVIAAGGECLNFISRDGKETEQMCPPGIAHILDVSPDGNNDRIFFSALEHQQAVIFLLDHSDGNKVTEIVKRNGKESVEGIAYDTFSSTLYWTDANAHTVSKGNVMVDPLGVPNVTETVVLHLLEDEKPRDIIVDPCHEYVYWSNCKENEASIQRSRLNGTEREIIVQGNLTSPNGLALDLSAEKIYWIHDVESIPYYIERSNLDGTSREVVFQDHNQNPYGLAVDQSYLYWTDRSSFSVWRIDKEFKKSAEQLFLIRRYMPAGIAVFEPKNKERCPPLSDRRYNPADTTHVQAGQESAKKSSDARCHGYCVHGECFISSENMMPKCHCFPGYHGEHCHLSLCYHYCLHGRCSIAEGHPHCDCKEGFSGNRCEKDVCSNFCLYGGLCRISESWPICTCPEGFAGKRCEVQQNHAVNASCSDFCLNNGTCVYNRASETTPILCLCQPPFRGNRCEIGEEVSSPQFQTAKYNFLKLTEIDTYLLLPLLVQSCICIFLMVGVALLAIKVWQLWKRPNLKKRYVTVKKPFHFKRSPSQNGSVDIELNLENCCNMNICETPCFEPSLRPSNGGTRLEEKNQLLSSMDGESHCIPCHSKDHNINNMF